MRQGIDERERQLYEEMLKHLNVQLKALQKQRRSLETRKYVAPVFYGLLGAVPGAILGSSLARLAGPRASAITMALSKYLPPLITGLGSAYVGGATVETPIRRMEELLSERMNVLEHLRRSLREQLNKQGQAVLDPDNPEHRKVLEFYSTLAKEEAQRMKQALDYLREIEREQTAYELGRRTLYGVLGGTALGALAGPLIFRRPVPGFLSRLTGKASKELLAHQRRLALAELLGGGIGAVGGALTALPNVLRMRKSLEERQRYLTRGIEQRMRFIEAMRRRLGQL